MSLVPRRSLLFTAAGVLAGCTQQKQAVLVGRPPINTQTPKAGVHLMFHGMFSFLRDLRDPTNPRLLVYAPEVPKGTDDEGNSIPDHKYKMGDLCVQTTIDLNSDLEATILKGNATPGCPKPLGTAIPELAVTVAEPSSNWHFKLSMPMPDYITGYRATEIQRLDGVKNPNVACIPLVVRICYESGTAIVIAPKGEHPIPTPTASHVQVYAEPDVPDQDHWEHHLPYAILQLNQMLGLPHDKYIALTPKPGGTLGTPAADDDLEEREEKGLAETPCKLPSIEYKMFSTNPAHCFSVGGKLTT